MTRISPSTLVASLSNENMKCGIVYQNNNMTVSSFPEQFLFGVGTMTFGLPRHVALEMAKNIIDSDGHNSVEDKDKGLTS